MPPTVPINHYLSPQTNEKDISLIPLFHANVFKASACLKHSNLFKVKYLIRTPDTMKDRVVLKWMITKPILKYRLEIRNSTTSFLTATTLIYAIGAGITVAAGTRLALQLFIDKILRLFSFQF